MGREPMSNERMPSLVPVAVRRQDILSARQRLADRLGYVGPILNLVVLSDLRKGTVVRFVLFTTKGMDRDGSDPCADFPHQVIGDLNRPSKSWM